MYTLNDFDLYSLCEEDKLLLKSLIKYCNTYWDHQRKAYVLSQGLPLKSFETLMQFPFHEEEITV